MKYFIFLYSLILFWSCDTTTKISSIENKSQKVEQIDSSSSNELDSFLLPYRIELNRKMQDTIAFSDKELKKYRPESELGNWVADGMLWTAKNTYRETADLAICNYGGLRTKSLPKNHIQLRHIYELMPFENELVILSIDSNELKTIFHRMMEKDGWPISKGVKLIVSNSNQIIDWSIHGVKKNNYRIVLSDYIANGGDGMDILIPKEKQSLKILIRDALASYARYQKNLVAELEGRIVKQ